MKKIIFVLMTVALFSVSHAETNAPTDSNPSKEERMQKREERKKMREERKAAREDMKEKIKSACAEDISKTGCTGEGKDLLRCVHDYKKSNKDFKASDSCKSAMKEGRAFRHEQKKKREEAKSTTN
jgi:hypothetical protein